MSKSTKCIHVQNEYSATAPQRMCNVFYWLPCQTGIQTPACRSDDKHHVSLQCMDRLHVLVVQHYNYAKRPKTEAPAISIFYNLQLVFHKQAINNQLNLSICCNLKKSQLSTSNHSNKRK